jgi:hypothetical protein
LLPPQQGSDSRWLHPQFYDWPGQGSEAFAAMLPVLNWTAARASDVVVQVLTEWKRVLAQHSDLPTPPPTLYCNTRHLRICNSPDDPAKLRMRPPKKSTPQCFFIRVCSRTCSTSLVRCRWRRITLRTAGRASRASRHTAKLEADLDLASMDTRAGPTTTTAMGRVRCPLLTAMPGLATDIRHRNLLRAAPPTGAATYPTLGRATKTAALRGPRGAFGNLWRCDAAHCLPPSALVQW